MFFNSTFTEIFFLRSLLKKIYIDIYISLHDILRSYNEFFRFVVNFKERTGRKWKDKEKKKRYEKMEIVSSFLKENVPIVAPLFPVSFERAKTKRQGLEMFRN